MNTHSYNRAQSELFKSTEKLVWGHRSERMCMQIFWYGNRHKARGAGLHVTSQGGDLSFLFAGHHL